MPDLVLVNANAITMDPAYPAASLVAIQGDRIAAVSSEENLEQLRGQGTQIIDCAGKTILPGFVDAHCHVHAYAESLISLNLSPRKGIRSILDIQNRIRDFCKDRPPGTWVRGKGYNEFYLSEGRHPDRRDLDAAAPLHPVKLTHRSGHAHVLNSLALEMVGITVETGDPPGGLMDRELGTGEPTGILYSMGEFLSAKVPFVDDADMERGFALANAELLACGITSVQDASHTNNANQRNRLESYKARGIFQPRLVMMLGLEEFGRYEGIAANFSSRDCRLGGVKILLGRVSGTLHPCQEELNEKVSAIHAARLQAIIHAVEEPEIEAACNAVAYAMHKHRLPDHRHRIEHCSVCPPRLLRRIADLGISVVTQPSFIYVNGDRYLKTVPEDQRAHLYAIGSMMKHGLRVGFSSDFPISDVNPMVGIQTAVTRMTEEGQSVLPQEGISVPEALLAYTQGAAAANFEDTIKGSISKGKLADLVLLNEDPRIVDPTHIKDIRAILTMIGGRIVWRDPGFLF
jgi:predicted amidohydrolase YtcJ